MMGFLDNYLTVNQKIKLLHEKYPYHRLVVSIVDYDLKEGYVFMKCDFFRDEMQTVPTFTDFAYGNVAFYPNNMKRWFIEDTSTSVQGRVAAVALALDEKPNRETMEQVERSKAKDMNPSDQGAWGIAAAKQENIPTAASVMENIEAQLGAELVAESPVCEHGNHMIFKMGEKNGREWGGWFCTEKTRSAQCQPKFGVRSATTGNWRLA